MPTGNQRLPWITISVCLAAWLVWMLPTALQSIFIYDRSAIIQGQAWRLWTGHLVHFTPSHLGWNLTAFVLAASWCERANFPHARWFVLLAPPSVSLVLLAFDSRLQLYGGLSGLITSVVAFCCVSEWRFSGPTRRRFWLLVLTLLVLKILGEYYSGMSAFVRLEGTYIQVAPISHLSGLCIGIIFAILPVTHERKS